jgi:two-component system OmpR family response regulator
MTELILLIEDDKILARQVCQYIEKSGYDVILAHDGMKGLETFQTKKPNLILIDWMLPEINGIDVCREIRKSSNVPIIMLTAKGDETDKVIGLELGADDYMTKPYSLKELLARIRVNLRRISSPKLSTMDTVKDNILSFPHFELKVSNHKLLVNNQALTITRSEFDLLLLFCNNPERVFSRNELLDHVSGRESGSFDRSVDVHISNLRKKIEPDPKKPIYLITVWGVGYRFEGKK